LIYYKLISINKNTLI